MKRLYSAAEETLKINGRGRQTAIAKLIGATSQTVKNWELRDSISKDGLIKLSKALNISIDWLEHGTGHMLAEKAPSPLANFRPAPIGTRSVPLISYVQAGHWMDAVNIFQPGDAQEWLLTDLDLPDSCFALEIKGESMLPEFKEGDRIIIDPTIEPRPGDFVVAKNGDNEATFKKYRPKTNDRNGNLIFELVPLNEDFPVCRSDITPITIIGVMVEYRKYRKK